MNRKEFMGRLEQLLSRISAEERAEALQYYTDYFEDAGAENESAVIAKLGSPEKVAATIMADLRNSGKEEGEFTENGYSDARFEKKENLMHRGSYRNEESPRTSRGLKIALIILIAIVVVPTAWPLLIGALGIVIGLVCAAFGIFAGLVIGAVSLMIVGIVIFIAGLTKLLVALPVALLTAGSGLVLFVLGVIATVATVRLCMVVYPAMVRGIITICRWPFHRKAVM
ncbi:MAG: hypothetical protein QM793_07130 [Muricomes sp.]